MAIIKNVGADVDKDGRKMTCGMSFYVDKKKQMK